MQVERVEGRVLRVTLHVYEMATLIAAARWALEGGVAELTPDARDQLRQVLASYERAGSVRT